MGALTPSIIAVLFFTLFQLVSAQSHLKGNSHEKRFSGSLQRRHTTHLAKRFSNAQFTYYIVGVGACGHDNKPSDFIVALNSAQYGSGGYCGMTITITYGGKSTQATIMDECPGCPFGGLDFSEGLFTFFAPTSVGTLFGEWVFGSSQEAETTKTPKSTSTPPPSPTTSKKPATSTTPPMTSTSTTTTTSKISSTTSSVPPSTSSSATTTTPSSSSVPSTGPTPADGAEALYELGTVLAQLSTFVEQIVFHAE